MTQEAMASALDIATKNVQRLESGTQNLTLKTIERVATVLGVTPESFFTGGAEDVPNAGPATPAKHLRGPADLVHLAGMGYSVRAATEGGRRPKAAIPVVDLRAVAGRPTRGARSADVIGWVSLGRSAPPTGQFVTKIEGASMEPRIPKGAFVLFGPPSPGPLRGRTFLIEQPELLEGDLGGPYVVKRVARVVRSQDGVQRVTLRSENRAYPDRVVIVRTETDLRIVAELVRVLDPC